MSIKIKLKNLAEKIPPGAGVIFNLLPFKMRLGNDYENYFKLADRLINANDETKKIYIIKNFNKIFNHFKLNNRFYNQLLKKANTSLREVKELNEISDFPISNKALLREIPISDRTIIKYGFKQFNTGGTTGMPLSFYMEKNFYSREWAHMHYMWKKIGYNPTHTKITIRGKNIDNIYSYNFNQNEFIINSYHSFNTKDYLTLLKVFKKYNTEFIHGYPSSIYNFLKEASLQAPFLIDFLKKNIKGIMFGSEFPSPHYRDYIEDILTKNTISWYGHTEGVILAGELFQKFEYFPFLSYGYAEAVKIDDYFHLVGTCFSNLATPFIRYDTEDLINPNLTKDGILESFEIKEGRLGEFVTDKNNKNISLTALIFGRHHKLFDKVDFIQVKQIVPGEIVVYYSNSSFIQTPSDLFDSSNVNIDLSFQQVKEPFKTPLGKIPLLIK
ncbi:MAG TPA: CoF synthetase [Ignavibacteria bacterium]